MTSFYLAGPEVFYPDAKEFGQLKLALCERYGFTGLYPLDNELDLERSKEPAQEIYRGNLAMMQQADGIIANITPFRGVGMDPGTAFEVGYFVALGKPVYLYSNDSRAYKDRVNASQPVDENGFAIEDFGLPDNLMIACSAVGLVCNAPVNETEKYRSLANFEQLLVALVGQQGRQ